MTLLAALRLGAITLLLVLTLLACGEGRGIGPDSRAVDIVSIDHPPAGQLPPGITPLVYRLDLVTDPDAEGFTGSVEIDVRLDAPHARIWLHALGLEILYAAARLPDGSEIPAVFTGNQAEGGVARLDFDTPLPAGQSTLLLDYSAPYNAGLAGLYKVTQDGRPYLASQMQPIDARRMVPSFDEPRFKTVWAVSVTAPEGLKVVANAPLISEEPAADGQVRHIFNPTRPIPSYLLALAVGPYDESPLEWIPIVSGLRPAPVPFRGFAAAGKGSQLAESLAAIPDMLLWQEKYFAEAYPYGKLDLIAAPDFSAGAMENPGAIIYRESAILLTDRSSLAQRRWVMYVHTHELAHQWFGNLVTPKWWNDLWLNESFATWFGYKTMHAIDPGGEWDLSPIQAGLGAMSADSLESARQVRNPIARNADINDAFDSITYSKGGSLLNMFETYLGEERFRDGIRLHISRFADGVADADDFMQSLAQGAGDEAVTASFRSFIMQPGIPMLDVQVTCESDGRARIGIMQTRYAPLGSDIRTDTSSWHIPVTLRAVRGEETALLRQMLSGRRADMVAPFCPDYVIPNAGGTGYWRFVLDSAAAGSLAENLAKLSTGEQLVYLDSLIAAFQAGRASADDLLGGLSASVAGSPAAVSLPFGALRNWHRRLDPDGQALLSAWIEQTYGPVETALARKSQAEDLSAREQLLHAALTDLLLSIGERSSERAAMLARAEAYIGTVSEAGRDALSPDTLRPAMAAALREGGDSFAEAALTYALRSSDQNERSVILSTLAGQGSPQFASGLLMRAGELGISASEFYTLLNAAARNHGAQQEVWPLIESRFADLVTALPESRRAQFGAFAGALCSRDDLLRYENFLNAQAANIPGYERPLAQGAERARLCIAEKDELIPALSAALSERAGE